ncbi:stage II sporulation protein P [Sulfobacillus acidophilus TPY]|nr:stage II sporulation protein P [Sulfobacillus acidophilus TPY]
MDVAKRGWTPVVIWFRTTTKNRYWARRRKPAGRAPRLQWPKSLAVWYGLSLLGAVGVLWRFPPAPTVRPVTASLYPVRPSWLDRTFTGLKAPVNAAEDWLNRGIPLIGLVLSPHQFALHLGALVSTGLTEVSGVRLSSLPALLQVAIPVLKAVPPPTESKTPIAPPPAIPGANERDASLPGDQGRVWAVLGQTPVVGIYQTHSHESFWPYLPSGTNPAYSTYWPRTIVQVGWWLAEALHRQGLSVVQSRVDNMAEGVLASYSQAYFTAKQLIRGYPTVKLLIDLHRASTAVAPAEIRGQAVSRILIVVGTNKLLPNEYWHQNLTAAIKLAKALNRIAPGILQGNGIDMVPYRYNQELMPGDLMIEVGGPNSTLGEEKRAVEELALAIHAVLSSRQPGS